MFVAVFGGETTWKSKTPNHNPASRKNKENAKYHRYVTCLNVFCDDPGDPDRRKVVNGGYHTTLYPREMLSEFLSFFSKRMEESMKLSIKRKLSEHWSLSVVECKFCGCSFLNLFCSVHGCISLALKEARRIRFTSCINMAWSEGSSVKGRERSSRDEY
jgi:hypothetical protein